MVALGCAITAAFVLEFALQMANGPLTVAGFLFYNTASAWAPIMMVSAFSSLRSSKAALAGWCAAWRWAKWCAWRILRFRSSWALSSDVLVRADHRDAVSSRRATAGRDRARSVPGQPRTVQSGIVLAACSRTVFMRRIVQRCDGLRTHAQRSVPCSISVDVSAVVLVGVAAWMLLSRSESKEDMLFSFAMLLVVAGFIIAPFTF
ncbi:MAG: hypothetical protein ACLSVD_16905 [Eggerthellaceae bacterium]